MFFCLLLHLLLKDPDAPELRISGVRLKRDALRSSVRVRYAIQKTQ